MVTGSDSLTAGFGRTDITPAPTFPNGMWMAQTHARASGIHRRLFVSCLALGSGAEHVLILSFDLCILSHRQVDAIRARVGEETGVDREAIWLFCTHNHAGPVTQDFYDREGADEVRAYVAALPEWSAEAAVAALAARRPARVRGGRGSCGIAVNRDLLHRERVITGPNPAGVVDPTVDVLRVDGPDGEAMAGVVTYGMHPTYLGPGNTLVSPDYPGVTRDVFEEITGAPCIFLLSGAGNAGPLRGFESTTDAVERDGTILACEAAAVFLGIDTSDAETVLSHVIESGAPLGIVEQRPRVAAAELRAVTRRVPLPTGNPGPTVYDTAQRDLDDAQRQLAELQAAGAAETEIQHAMQHALRHRLRLDRRHAYLAEPTYEVAVRALAVGGTCLVSVECEAYAEIAVAVREHSPFPRTVFAAYEGADVIYVAPSRYYAPPVPMQVFNSPFAREAADVLVQSTLETMRSIASRPA